MIRIRNIQTIAFFLLLGIAGPAYAWQEKPEKQQEKAKPERQEHPAKAEKQQEAKAPKQEQRAKPEKQQEARAPKPQQAKPQKRQEQAKAADQPRQQKDNSAKEKQRQQAKGQHEQKHQQQQDSAKQQQSAKVHQDKQPNNSAREQQQAKGQQEQKHRQQNNSVKQQQQAKVRQDQLHQQRQQHDNYAAQHRSPAEVHVQQVAWQGDRARSWRTEHHTWQQRGGYNGYRVPDERFRTYYGQDHGFRIFSLPVIEIGGHRRFQYGGYWFGLVDPWPEYWDTDWYDNDDVYVDYYGDGYYLHNRQYPNDRIAISFYMN